MGCKVTVPALQTRKVHQNVSKTACQTSAEGRGSAIDFWYHRRPGFFWFTECLSIGGHACRLIGFFDALGEARKSIRAGY